MKKSKMIIVMRTDLNMRKGKMVAQGSHSSLKLVLELMSKSNIAINNSKLYKYDLLYSNNSILGDWLEGKFTKICVRVDSEEELLNIYNKSLKDDSNVMSTLIEDNGATEFNGIKTKTCCAILGWSEDVDKITGELKLL